MNFSLSLNKTKLAIATISLTILVTLIAGTYFLTFRQGSFKKWVYCGTINLNIPAMQSVKDPEFVRYPNHTLFMDSEGFYYIVASIFKTDGRWLTGVLKTKDLHYYNFVGYTPMEMDGKIAPFCIYIPENGKFFLYYSDWKNTVDKDIRMARLGLAIGNNIKNPLTFFDHGYLTIENMPEPLAPHLG